MTAEERHPVQSGADSPVRTQQLDQILLVTLARPAVRNAVNHEMAALIEAALDRLEDDPDLRVGVLAAEGSAFCGGADLRIVMAGGALPYTDRGSFAGLVRRDRQKPLVVACEGPAVGGGFEIVLACDVVVASTSASFGLPEVKRGLFAGGGGVTRLGAAVPRAAAMAIGLSGDSISAERAYQLGLVSELVEPGRALATALGLAGRLAGHDPEAVRLTRHLIEVGGTVSAEEAWAANDAAVDAFRTRPDYGAGARDFLAQRDVEEHMT